VIYFANPSTGRIRAVMARGELGCILTPRQGNKLPPGTLWCADNGCGPGAAGPPGSGFPGNEAYLHWLARMVEQEGADPCDPDQSGLLFAVAPDVVGDSAATLERERVWHMLGWMRHELGVPVAFVGQNGQEHRPVPWDDFDVLFLGGSPECVPCGYVKPWDDGREHCPFCHRQLREWKLGTAARALVAEAKRRGKRAHMGRVNSLQRVRYANAIGCDSADGTYLKKAPDKNLPRLLGWLRDIHTQGSLFDLAGAV
jgi:hypothetical protein